ncbi:MAG: hypothetical protein CVT92_17090 [Bacteroidetes bacterium HGW-Bacteroidetes-1]|jgi:hypothetical protein|nr:MAG: hypothetical protein CVT92_17090 [Bacteroidetes bacterium HGW-Bacteroidetes-1]
MPGGGTIAILLFESSAPAGMTSLSWKPETKLLKSDNTEITFDAISNIFQIFPAPELTVFGQEEY